jgi:hypothetical protein
MLFADLSLYVFYLILAITTVLVLKNLILAKELVQIILRNKRNLIRWKKGIINLEDIKALTPREFQYWCGEFISRLGYSSIKQLSENEEDGKDIVCQLGPKPVYVKCERHIHNKGVIDKIDLDICKKLVGSMTHDGVTIGIIITSGIILEECQKYIESLPTKYRIDLIDGETIIKLYSTLHEKEQTETA